jgi:hypothetical protein
MTSRVSKQRNVFVDRNQEIWRKYAHGVPMAEIGREFGLTEQRISQIIPMVAATIPVEDRSQIVKLRRSYVDLAKAIAMEIAQEPAKPSFAPNGKPHVDPKTGEPIMDNSERLAAVQTALKADERLARLTGTDNAIQHVLETTSEVQAATQKAADEILTKFPMLLGAAS